MSWFNIGSYLKLLREAGHNMGIKSIRELNLEIYNDIKIIDFVFQVLITKGVLSQFLPDKNITNLDIIGEDKFRKVNEIIKNKYFEESDNNKYANGSYYYLTDLLYLHSGILFKELSKNSWYTMAAMEWVSQIGF